MKKRNKIILMVVASIVLLGIVFGTVDYLRANNNKLPIFTIHIPTVDDWDKYYGLGYIVVTNEKCEGDYIKFGFIFSTYACVLRSDYTDINRQ